MQLLNAKPQDTVIFEDSKSGIESALGSKALCVGFHTPGLTDSHINNADFVIEDYTEILKRLNQDKEN